MQKSKFTIEVTFDEESGLWCASSEALSVFTEADSYDELVDRVWLIAPEMAMENGSSIPEHELKLVFMHESEHHAFA